MSFLFELSLRSCPQHLERTDGIFS